VTDLSFAERLRCAVAGGDLPAPEVERGLGQAVAAEKVADGEAGANRSNKNKLL
jgi:hypothetical protein